jgi:uncharacterized protein with PhoU and TrkA domain
MTPSEIVDLSYSSPISDTEYASLSSKDLRSLKAILENEVVAKAIQISRNSYLCANLIANAEQTTQIIDLQRAAQKIVSANIKTIESVLQQSTARSS